MGFSPFSKFSVDGVYFVPRLSWVRCGNLFSTFCYIFHFFQFLFVAKSTFLQILILHLVYGLLCIRFFIIFVCGEVHVLTNSYIPLVLRFDIYSFFFVFSFVAVYVLTDSYILRGVIQNRIVSRDHVINLLVLI